MKSRYNKTTLAKLWTLASTERKLCSSILRFDAQPVLGQARRWIKLIASVSVMSLLAFSAKANLISNGSFEGPVLSANGIYQYIQPTFWGDGISYYIQGAVGGGWPAPQEGQQFVDLVGGYSLSQNINIVTPGIYQLTWYDNSLAPSSYDYYMYIGDVPNLQWSTFAGTGGPTWTARSLSLNLAAGVNTLRFFGNGGHTLLDNVVLEATAAASVPDGGSAAVMLLLGVSSLAILRRTGLAAAGS